MSVAILGIGSELLDGRVQDTNCRFAAEILSASGIRVSGFLFCDDVQDEILAALHFLFSHAHTVIVSGGLGPTTDDLTRESIASFFGRPLVRNDSALQRLRDLFASRKRRFDPSNEKQALFPEGARSIANKFGSAEGFQLEDGSRRIFALPGVPLEFEQMFPDSVAPLLGAAHEGGPLSATTFKIFGLPESFVGSRVREATATMSGTTVSYRASFPEIHVKIKGNDSAEVRTATDAALKAIGDECVFTQDPDSDFTRAVHEILLSRGRSLAVAESCTGGMVGMHLTQYEGASTYFRGGVLAYDNSVKVQLLAISEEALSRHGAVSLEVACAMAEGVRRLMGTDLGVSITGIAGPSGGSDEKPVGTFYVALSRGEQSGPIGHRYYFKSTRDGIRRYAAYVALDMLRRDALGLPFSRYQSTVEHV